jgi:glycosyltransferase involved in cell wall biosynthesis
VNVRRDVVAAFGIIVRKCRKDHYYGGSYSFLVARILYCGDIGAQTGFGRVAEELIPRLTDKHEIYGLAVNWHGDPSPMQQYCRMYPAHAGGPDPFGSHRIADLAAAIKPDLVWMTNDLWCLPPLLSALKPVREQVPMKVYGYVPIDSYGIFPEFMPHLDGLDGLGTYTQFGKEEIVKAGYSGIIDVIPHGVDRSKFFPLDRNEARQAMGIGKDDFVVFNGNRNQPRKRIDITIKGFIRFAKNRPNARLWLHMGTKDQGWDIIPLFNRVARDYGYDPAGRLILTNHNFSVNNCLSIADLNRAYNAADIGVNTCIAEGWGLVNFEQAATGVAQLVPDHTSLKEIFYGVKRIDCLEAETDRGYGLERPIPSAVSMAERLAEYYENPQALQDAGEWCFSRATDPAYDWNTIVKQMTGIIDRCLNEQPTPIFKGFGTPVRLG